MRKFPDLTIVWGQILWQKGVWNLLELNTANKRKFYHCMRINSSLYTILISNIGNYCYTHSIINIAKPLFCHSLQCYHCLFHLPCSLYLSCWFTDSNSSSPQNSEIVLCLKFHLGIIIISTLICRYLKHSKIKDSKNPRLSNVAAIVNFSTIIISS